MNLIAIESSTSLCSVSSFKNGDLSNVIDLVDSKEHSKKLPHIIQEMMKDFDDFKEIYAFAVSIGPGSFTSVRIALSIVKGLAFGLKNNIVPIQTLEGMNFSINHDGLHYVGAHAFKDKCYLQKFNGKVAVEKPFIDNFESIDKLDNQIYLYSKNEFNEKYQNISPSSISVGQYAMLNYSRLVKKYNEDVVPIYLSENQFVKINDNKSK